MRTAILLLPLLLTGATLPKAPAMKLGTCQSTRVARVMSRLEERDGTPVPDSGSAVTLANGIYGVSYARVAAVDASRPGDRVLACLVRLPTRCPPGDDRGKWYTVTNLRSMQSWTLPDAEHECGGA